MKKVSIINFSGHHKGNGENISLYMSEYMKKKKIDVEDIGFSDIDAHGCGICEYECFTKDRHCPYMEDGIVHIYKTIASSDFCFFIIPNYSDVPCSNYFIFRERSQCVVDNNLWQQYAKTKKHFIVISSTSRDYFISLLKNEIIDQELNITFFNSNDVGSKTISGDFLEYTYFLHLLDQILNKYV